MSDDETYIREIAALLIADIRTSGARTRHEIECAFRDSVASLLGAGPIPDQISILMPKGEERWPKVVVKRPGSPAT